MDISNKDIYMNKTKMYIDEFGNKIFENSKGELHRLDGPAIEYSDGSKLWYKEEKQHRTDGPAVEYAHGDKFWYILDKMLKEKGFNLWIQRIKKSNIID